MGADPNNLRFYVDESALGLGKTLARARNDVIHVGHPLIKNDCPLGALDVDWIPHVAARDLIVIARDRHIRTRPAERKAYLDSGLRAFWIGGKKDMPTWEWLTIMVRSWERMEKIVEHEGPGPWGYIITASRIVPTDLSRP